MLERVVEQHGPRLEPLQREELLVLGLPRRVVQRLRPSDDGEDAKDAVPVAGLGGSARGTRRGGRDGTHRTRASEIVARSFSSRIATSALVLLRRRFELRTAMAM